ncbi:MAG: DNA-processing protein DprA [Eubacteriales bacterium]|nr:DNA-processing protein DprA [Eubacteriales bacterium]
MTGAQRGFLLLCSHLGDPQRRPLTTAQLRLLARRVQTWDRPGEDRELNERDLLALGYGPGAAAQILLLLSQEDVLDHYLQKNRGMTPVTRADAHYPPLLRRRLGEDAPGCLWTSGDCSLLDSPTVALVGSRDLQPANRDFARAVGLEAARQGLTLVSGNARGADRAAQDACLAAGGRVISVVADELSTKIPSKNLLFVSEEDCDAPFSAQRALSRNRIIHCLGSLVFVAQCTFGQGGTWDGTTKNLDRGWSPVAVFDDGSQSANELEAMGAFAVREADLQNLDTLGTGNSNFLSL